MIMEQTNASQPSIYFFSSLKLNSKGKEEFTRNLENYCNKKEQRVYLLNFPVIPTKHCEYQDHFMMLIPGYKIVLVKVVSSESDYDEYKEDVEQAISYLYQNYNYRQPLGRFSTIWSELFITDTPFDSIKDLDSFFIKCKLDTSLAKRKSELIISLCIGNAAEIDKIGVDVPVTLLEKVKNKVLLFDANQSRFIFDNYDSSHRIIKIQGLAGTGKTELLMHKIKVFYTKSENSKVFLTCHNKILASSLRKRIVGFFNSVKVWQQIEWNERLWCANAWGRSGNENSGLYRFICYHYDIPFLSYNSVSSFDVACKIALRELESKGKDFEPFFDNIVIDECQDFENSFFDLCMKVTKGNVVCAGDVFQSIFSENIENALEADYLLNVCYRTAPDTLMFAHALGLGYLENKRYRWLNNKALEACGYIVNDEKSNRLTISRFPAKRFDDEDFSYESIKLIKTSSDNLNDDVVKIVQSIKKENNGNIKPEDIAIILLDDSQWIYGCANSLEILFNEMENWNVNKTYETKIPSKSEVTISNRNNVKGLEFPYVICITDGLKDNYSYRNSIYTMLARSYICSYLVTTDEGRSFNAEIISGLEEITNHHTMTIKIASKEEQEKISFRIKENNKLNTHEDIINDFSKKNRLTPEQQNKIREMLDVLGYDYDLDKSELESKLSEIKGLL